MFLNKGLQALCLSTYMLIADASPLPGDDHALLAAGPIPTAAPDVWVHPGVLVSKPQLGFVAEKVQQGAEPWSEAYESMLNYNLSTPTRTASPREVVECGPTSTPNLGCYEEREDSMAAYINALAYWISGEESYAKKSIYYMNAWSSTLKGHNNSNAPLQAGWSAANWVRAAELIRHSDACWSEEGVEAFENMLLDVYLPIIIDGAPTQNGNWELVMMESAIGIAIFTESPFIYSRALSTFLRRVPEYIYLLSDGPLPLVPPQIDDNTASVIDYWNNQQTFQVDGISQETCRDFAHTSYGISSISHVAESVRIQGLDLWQTHVGERVAASLKLHAPFQLRNPPEIPEWLCNGTIDRHFDPVGEVPYAALAVRLGKEADLGQTREWVLQQRPAQIGEKVPLFFGFETVTHGDNPA
jgi:hypothetical protein